MPDPDHALVVAEARHVDAHDDRVLRPDPHVEADVVLVQRHRDQLQRACVGEQAPHPDLEEVAVLAVVLKPLLEQLLVGALDVPAVDPPAIIAAPEAAFHVLEEAPGVPRRVAEVERHRLTVG